MDLLDLVVGQVEHPYRWRPAEGVLAHGAEAVASKAEAAESSGEKNQIMFLCEKYGIIKVFLKVIKGLLLNIL